MKSRKKKLKPRHTTARNYRDVVYKYLPLSERHSIAIKGGRCYKCSKITTDFCYNCSKSCCKKHFRKLDEEIFCADCSSKHDISKMTVRDKKSYIG